MTFDPETEGEHLKHALDYFQYQLKGVSFLPRMEHGAFPQVWPTTISLVLSHGKYLGMHDMFLPIESASCLCALTHASYCSGGLDVRTHISKSTEETR